MGSKPPVIAVDVDGVIADLHTVWIARYNAEYNDTLTHEQVNAWDMHNFVKPECGTKIYNYLADPTMYDDVLPYPGALEGVKLLLMAGSKVVYATSCVYNSLNAKWDWLEKYGFFFDLAGRRSQPMLIAVTDKSLLNADLLIDDYPENLKVFAGKTILFDQPYNRTFQTPHRARHWIGETSSLSPWSVIYHVNNILREKK
jgi:5'(3')-deoxyribonucleotidase